jgi:hypothetical protein
MGDLNTKQRKSLDDKDFAVPRKRKLPINDATHIKLAWDMVDRTKGLTMEERTSARKKILAAAKDKGIDTSSWNKKSMEDTVISEIKILNDDVNIAEQPLKVRFKGSTANVVNENKRLYPAEVLKDAVERFKAKLPVIGESPHPPSLKSKAGNIFFDTKVENSVMKITDVFMDNMDVFFDAEILNTAKGKDVQALIKQNVPVGDSIRMLGTSVKRIIDGIEADVATYLDIQAWDLVMNPATDGCKSLKVLTDSQISDAIEDGIEIGNPGCPLCGADLTAQDPDNDGDVDFYVCESCGQAFVENHSVSSQVSANTNLCMVTLNDFDRYPQAQSWLANNQAKKQQIVKDNIVSPLSDGKEKGDGEILNKEELMKILKDDPDVKGILEGTAKGIAQPALDSVEKQKAAEMKEQAKSDAKAFLGEKMAALDGKISKENIKMMTDAIGEPENKEIAQTLFDSMMKVFSSEGAKTVLNSVGFKDGKSPEGKTHFDVTENAKPWRPVVDEIIKATDHWREQFGDVHDEKLRAYNQKNFAKVYEAIEKNVGEKALYDSVREGRLVVSNDREGRMLPINDSMQGAEFLDAVSVTTSQVLNQPTILTAVIVQAFQDVESAQFMFTDVFKGSEWRLPIETFTSAAQYNPLTGLPDLAVSEGVGITPSTLNLGWQSFSPTWRRNAVSITEDVIRQLETGPLNYATIARATYHIAFDKRRKVDDAAYLEMLMASDEYAPFAVSSETPASASAVTATGVPSGSNASYLYALKPTTVKYEAPTISSSTGNVVGGNPVVRPRITNQIQPSGQVKAVTVNPVSITVGGTALVLGAWDGTNIVSFSGTTAQAAVDFEHGVVYFNSASGVNPSASTPILPCISYSAVTNFDRWHSTLGSGYNDIAAYYDTFLQQLTATSALMGSSPRYKKPNLAIFSLNSAAYVENARIFYKWASPTGTSLIDTGNTFGMRSGMNLSKINAPWVAGDGRVLLTQKGSTRYGIETPYSLEGPYPVYDNNQQIIDAKLWYGKENSVLCTPQVRDTSFNIINPVSRTIIIEA